MDLASVIGMIVCMVMVIFGIITGDEGPRAIWNFLEYKSALITFGGAIFAVMAQYSLKDFIQSFKSIKNIFIQPKFDDAVTIKNIIEL